MNIAYFKNLEELLRIIEKQTKISLFVHVNPDFDALGAAFGLRTIIKENLKNIDVEIIGLDKIKNINSKIFDLNKSNISDEFIKNSLGIVLDVVGCDRILDNRTNLCDQIIYIDHHPISDHLPGFNIINPEKSSTCEIIIDFLRINKYSSFPPKLALNYLYTGLLTDTNRFLYENSNDPNTFLCMQYLIEHGLDRKYVHDNLYIKSINELKANSRINKLIKINSDVGYIIIPKSWIIKFNKLDWSEYVNNMAGYYEIKIWFLAYYDISSKMWKVSIRSRDYQVNKIANSFGGGGHKLAAGFKIQNLKLIKDIIKKSLILMYGK